MNIFNNEFFDERIIRTQNDAAAIAYRVLIFLLMPIVILFEKFGEPSAEHYMMLGAIVISFIVESIITYERGVNAPVIEEEIERVQQSAKARRFYIYTMLARIYTTVWFMVYLYKFERPFTGNLVGILLVLILGIGTFPHPKNWLYNKVFRSGKVTSLEKEAS